MSSDQIKSFQVKCPQCGLLALYSKDNPFRPFCSERCKTTDLGAWASEAYKVPVNSPMTDEFSSEGSDSGDDYSE